MVPVTYSLNLVVSTGGKHAGIFGGSLDAAWKASCDFQRACYELPIDHQVDIVVCSSGGYPKDMNLYQGCKGMLNAMRALKPGGCNALAVQMPGRGRLHRSILTGWCLSGRDGWIKHCGQILQSAGISFT